MRLWVRAVAEPKRIAAQVLTTSPMKVRTLGLMRESASQRTMVSSSTPQALPKALVQLWFDDLLADELGAGDAVVAIMRPPFRARPRRGWWSGSGSPARACRWA